MRFFQNLKLDLRIWQLFYKQKTLIKSSHPREKQPTV